MKLLSRLGGHEGVSHVVARGKNLSDRSGSKEILVGGTD